MAMSTSGDGPSVGLGADDPADQLIELERRAWTALSSSGEDARAFYDAVLAPEVLMLFPGGLVIDDRATVVASMLQADWSRFRLLDERVVVLSSTSAVLAYRVVATRGDGSPYEALLSSTYRKIDSSWRLVMHQQTPVGAV
jgi:Domain of unknown function (DUF4440)